MTVRQITAIQNVVENGGNVTKAMRDAGYSEATVNNPSNLTMSQAYQVAMQQGFIKHDITVDTVLEPIGKALKAKTRTYLTKTIYSKRTGRKVRTEIETIEEDNLQLQLSASRDAAKLMGLDKGTKVEETPPPVVDSEAILEAIKNGNIEELQRIVFRKDD